MQIMTKGLCEQREGAACDELSGPPAEYDEVKPLDPERFVWSALQDLERLAAEA